MRDKQNALLVVFKSRVLDVSDRERAIIQDVLKADPQPKGRYRWVYSQLARKLNKYIRKYKSLTPATRTVRSRLRHLFQCRRVSQDSEHALSLRGVVCDRQRFSGNAETAARSVEGKENVCLPKTLSAI